MLEKLLILLDRFLIYCAGANRTILEENASPAEKDKYTAIGVTVFCTAILAALSGGYAIFTIFESELIAGVIGVFWGSFIFNIDRMFIISMKKDDDDKFNFFKVIKVATPRIVLGSLLGLLISKPIELRLFSKEINEIFQQEELLKIRTRLNKTASELTSKNEELQKQVNKIKQQCEDEQVLMNRDLTGTGGSQQRGPGNIYKELKKQYDECQDKVNKELENTLIPDLITSNSQQIKKISQEIAKIEQTDQSLNIGSPSIFQQAVILHKLAEEKYFIFVIDVFISGLFIVIEISPILTKLLTPYGSYDAAIKMIEDSKKDYCNQNLASLKEENKAKFERPKEIRETFWKEVGGKFKYFIAQQTHKVFNQVENSDELRTIHQALAQKIIEKTKSELEKCIEKMNISDNFGQNDNYDENNGKSNPNQNKS